MLRFGRQRGKKRRALRLLRHRSPRLGRVLPQVPGRRQGLRGRRRAAGRRLRREGAGAGPARELGRCGPRSRATRVSVDAAEWDQLAADINRRGFYAAQLDGDELAGLREDRPARWTGCSAARSPRRRSAGASSPPNGSTRRCGASSRRATTTRWTPTRCYAADERVEFPSGTGVCDLGPVGDGQPGGGAVHAVEHRAGVARRRTWPSGSPSCLTRCPRGGGRAS